MTDRAPRRWHVAVVAAVVLAALLVAAYGLHASSRRVAGTNSVAPTDRVASLRPHQRVCIRDLWMPAGATGVAMQLATGRHGETPVHLTLRTPEGQRTAQAIARAHEGGPILFEVRALARAGAVSLCAQPDGRLDDVGGTATNPFRGLNYAPHPPPTGNVSPASVDGVSIPGYVAVRFLESRRRSVAAALPDGARRAALFRPGFVGSWTYVALAVLMALLVLAGAALLLGAQREPR